MTSTDDTLIAPEGGQNAETQLGENVTPSRSAADRGAIERGDSIGRYVVLGQLGAGGMGVVYLAYDPELDRKVAVKLLQSNPHTATDATDGRSRLLREAQAIAQLSHQNVISVYDVGTLDERVFVAMEFVDGETLTHWLERKRPWREVLRPFVAAGRGLAAAHAAGLIHRDFKPDNVMVRNDGRVRVLDFGLARPVQTASSPVVEARALAEAGLTTSSSSLNTPLTLTGAVMGTPAYMAPEQHLGETAGSATDQFAFCVALWEALYGKRPFRGDTLPVLAFQVTQGKIDPPEGGGVPRHLQRTLERGLRPRPEDRFPSMDALLTDLTRDPGRRRNRWLLAGVALAVAGGLGAAAQQTRTSAANACRSDAALTLAWSEDTRRSVRAAFEATSKSYAGDVWKRVDLAVGVWMDQWRAARAEACAATHETGGQSEALLSLRLTCLDRQAHYLTALADVWRAADDDVLLQASQAALNLPHVDECADVTRLQRAVPPPADPATVQEVESLRRDLEGLRAEIAAGRYSSALERSGPLVERARETAYIPVLSEALELRSAAAIEASEPDIALAAIEEATWAAEASGHDAAAARAWITAITVHSVARTEYARAHEATRRADAAIIRHGDPRPLRASFLRRKAMVLHAEAKYTQALAAHEEALAMLPDDERGKLLEGDIRNNMGATLRNLRKLDEAATELRSALDIWTENLGPRHPKLGRALVNLANVVATQEHDMEALGYLQRALKIFREAHGNDHAHVAAALNGIGLIYGELDNEEEAIKYFREAIPIIERTLGSEHAHMGNVLNNLANSLSSLGQLDEALALHQRTHELKRKLLGNDAVDVSYALDNLASVQHKLGNVEAARANYEESLATLGRVEDSDRYLAFPLTSLAKLDLEAGRPREALARLERAYKLQQVHDEGHVENGRTQFALARTLHLLRREPDRVRRLAFSALDHYESEGPHVKDELEEVRAFLEELGSAVVIPSG